MKSSNTIAKKAKNQGKSSRLQTRFSPFAAHEIKGHTSNKIAKIKQCQAKSERGSVLRPAVTLDKINGKMTQNRQKSSKAQPSLNEVFALRHARQG
jgi:hypothetical protein